MKKLVFATNNAHKLEEIRAILGDKVEIQIVILIFLKLQKLFKVMQL